MVRRNLIYRGWAMAMALLLSLCAFSQVDSSFVRLKSMSKYIGVGYGNVLDSYLSPYSQTGYNVKTMFELMGKSNNIVYQNLVSVDASLLKNHPGNVKTYAGGVSYIPTAMYDFGRVLTTSRGDFRLMAGPMLDLYLGGVYNMRNGNNPGQLKFHTMVGATGIAMYDWRVGRRTVNLRYQCMVPLLGITLMPDYGESYYEIYGSGVGAPGVVFAYVGNMPSMRHLLTANIPTGDNVTLMLGYSGDLIQTSAKGLKYHSYSHDFLLGFKYYYMRKSRKGWRLPVGEGI